ncbi:MAG: toll/interleukin-1 receptor domain-containing protein [Lachnospiraceae bacterium]|nr:toll/interleukin-1 receptor domain-containing protein [Lachnospiraceae bacterium]
MEDGTKAKLYDYYAFISYKRADFKWAKWIREKLQSYRLPGPTLRRYKGMLTKRLNPVFLDKMNLTPGMLEEGLKTEVQSSKYLIVICSRAARNDSKYLDEEIQFFLDGGGDTSRIITFIVDEYNDPINDTFPLRLQKACEESSGEVFCIDANSMEKRSALLELIAYMHGISVKEIIRDDMGRRLLAITAIAACLAATLSGSLYARYRINDYHTVKTAYYHDFTEQHGIAQGIGELTDEQKKHVKGYYSITSSEGKVRELRYENSYGRLIDNESELHDDNPVNLVYEYTNGILDKTIYKDTAGKTVLILDYTDEDLKIANLTRYTDQTGEKAYVGAAFLTPKGLSDDDQFDKDEDSINRDIVRYLFEYDENGYLSEKRYVSDMRHNYISTDKYGVAGLRYSRDDEGHKLSERFLYFEGDDNDATIREAYSEKSQGTGIYEKQYTYDDRGYLLETKYLDHDGKLIYPPKGVALIKREYDGQGNEISHSYYGTEEQPVFGKEGYSGIKEEYDEHGNLVKESYLGTDGKPVSVNRGYAGVAMEYDDRGYVTKKRFLGTDGKPILSYRKIACIEYKYDERGNVTEESYFGTEDEPVLCNTGYAVKSTEYDDYGNVIYNSYYGTDGKPVLNSGGYAGEKYEYDAQGRVTCRRYYDSDGKPVITVDDYAGYIFDYDERGNEVRRRFLDSTGEEIHELNITWEYDKHGNKTKEAYKCHWTNPLAALGYWTIKYEYDDFGNVIRKSYYNYSDEPVLREGDYSSVSIEYDRRGNGIRYAFYGLDGKPIVTAYNFAVIEYIYDERDRRIRTNYYGKDNEPVFNDLGYASIEYEFDERGNEIRETFYGVDGMPVADRDGFAYIEIEYDENGNEVSASCYGIDGKLITHLYPAE